MRISRTAPLMLLSVAILAGCNTKTKQQLDTLAHVDSIRVDSLANVRKDLLDEVMLSMQFVNEINTELAKARALASKPAPQLENVAESARINDERKAVVGRISHLVARLDSVQGRLAATRAQAQKLSRQDADLMAQVAAYEQNVADLQQSAERQRSEFQAAIDKQTTQIASLTSKVDTLNSVRVALADTVGQLTAEVNTAYYVVGTKEELLEKGILVAEGPKRFFIAGSRQVAPARQLDPSNFTKIDRLMNRTIALPDGEYRILSRQNPAYAAPERVDDGKIAGVLTISQPEQFWQQSPFLIIVRS